MFDDPHHVRSDCQAVTKAIREGWPVSKEVREACMTAMQKIVSDDESKRNQISATRVLLAADALNLQAEKIARGTPDVTVNTNLTLSGDNQILQQWLSVATPEQCQNFLNWYGEQIEGDEQPEANLVSFLDVQ